MAKGTAVVDFGAKPGTDRASVVVTGQTGLQTTSYIEAWIRAEATAEHPEDEVLMLQAFLGVNVPRSSIVVDTSFVIEVVSPSGFLSGTLKINWVWS